MGIIYVQFYLMTSSYLINGDQAVLWIVCALIIFLSYVFVFETLSVFLVYSVLRGQFNAFDKEPIKIDYNEALNQKSIVPTFGTVRELFADMYTPKSITKIKVCLKIKTICCNRGKECESVQK